MALCQCDVDLGGIQIHLPCASGAIGQEGHKGDVDEMFLCDVWCFNQLHVHAQQFAQLLDEGGFANGSDSNDGTYDRPFYSIAKALTKCANYRNDYIIILDSWDQDTYPININIDWIYLCLLLALLVVISADSLF